MLLTIADVIIKTMKKADTVATNKKAYHEYFIEDTYEAGIVLAGSEVKSVRLHNVSFTDSFVKIEGYNAILMNLHISPYEKGSHYNLPSKRPRSLLLHKREINKLKALVERKGYTLVPTRLYFKDALLKVEVGVAKGKHTYDKRQSSMEKEIDRNNSREFKYDKYE